MVKRILRFIVIFLGLAMLVPLGAMVYTLYDLNSGILADSDVVIVTWLDRNANGLREESEPPLPGTCVGYLYNLSDLPNSAASKSCPLQTDETGLWREFMAGEDCASGMYVYAIPPDSYQPTTDMAVKGCEGEFGFVDKNTRITQGTLTAEQFARREVWKTQIRNVLIGFLIFLLALGGTALTEKQAQRKDA